MDFFDKLGKKASETYHMTKEKTVKFSEEMKLKGKINEAKNKITELYEDIGHCVYNQYKTNIEEGKDEILAKCEEISKQFDEISKLETDILALKAVKKCVECGSEINKNDDFCAKCGKEQPKEEKIEVQEESNGEEIKEAEVVEINDAENETEKNDESNNNNTQEQ